MNLTAQKPHASWPEPDLVELIADEDAVVVFDAVGCPSFDGDMPASVAVPFFAEARAGLQAAWPKAGTDFMEWALSPGGPARSFAQGDQLMRVAAKTLPWLTETGSLSDAARRGPDLQVGDVIGIRATILEALQINNEMSMREMTATLSTQLKDAMRARQMIESPSFYLDRNTIGSLLETDMPDDSIISDVRLPFDAVMVCFPAFAIEGEGTDLVEGKIGALNGMILETNPGGDGLAETFTAIITVELCPDAEGYEQVDPDPIMLTVQGMWRHSVFAPVIANIAALLTWGSWDDPQPGPSLPPNPTVARKMVRTSAFRKAVRNGTFDGTRVIDISSASTRRGPDCGGTHASPRAHLRRGHWRRVRTNLNGGVTTGPDAVEGVTFARVPRRIPPTFVNQGVTSPAARSYKIGPR